MKSFLFESYRTARRIETGNIVMDGTIPVSVDAFADAIHTMRGLIIPLPYNSTASSMNFRPDGGYFDVLRSGQKIASMVKAG